MKYLKRVVIIVLCICLFSGFIDYNIYAMSQYIKDVTGYKDDRDDDLPEDADVVIENGGEMISSIKIPYIVLSFEKVIYGHTDLIDIRFFSDDIINTNSLWLTVRRMVRLFYRSTLYISFAIMLVFLIYIALKFTKSSLNSNSTDIKLNIGNPLKKGGSVIKSLKSKLFIQEWIIGIISLAALTFIINFMIYLSNYLLFSSPIGVENTIGVDNQKISVLFKNGRVPTGTNISIVGNVSEFTDFDKYIIVGDSRVVQMRGAVLSSNMDSKDTEFVGRDGADFTNMEELWQKTLPKIKKNTNVIVWMGTNDYNADTAINYAEFFNKCYNSCKSRESVLTIATIGPARKNRTTLNERYEKFSKLLRENLSSNIRINDIYTALVSSGYTVRAEDKYDVHYDAETYLKVYNLMKNGQTTVGNYSDKDTLESGEVINNFYFETNTEGLLIFLSQYNWSGFSSRNMFHIIAAGIVSICKYVLLGLFFFRMLILALIISISPILLLINIFKRINGVEGFLTKWIKLFMYLIFIRFIVYLVYYVLLQAVPGSIKTSPTYILVECLVLDILCIVSFFKVFKSLFKRERRIQR